MWVQAESVLPTITSSSDAGYRHSKFKSQSLESLTVESARPCMLGHGAEGVDVKRSHSTATTSAGVASVRKESLSALLESTRQVRA